MLVIGRRSFYQQSQRYFSTKTHNKIIFCKNFIPNYFSAHYITTSLKNTSPKSLKDPLPNYTYARDVFSLRKPIEIPKNFTETESYRQTQDYKKVEDYNTNTIFADRHEQTKHEFWIDSTGRFQLWLKKALIVGSLSIFLIYFCILREENEIDANFDMSLEQRWALIQKEKTQKLAQKDRETF